MHNWTLYTPGQICTYLKIHVIIIFDKITKFSQGYHQNWQIISERRKTSLMIDLLCECIKAVRLRDAQIINIPCLNDNKVIP